jgi:hypothetical protein
MQVFIANLFTTAKKLEQPTCPSKEKWIKKRVVSFIHWNIFTSKRWRGFWRGAALGFELKASCLLGRHFYHLNPLTSPDSPMKENEL